MPSGIAGYCEKDHVRGNARVSNNPHIVRGLRSLMLEQFTITRRLLCITILTAQQGTHNSIIS